MITNINTLIKLSLLAMVLPILIHSSLGPTISKFFISAASVEIISSSNILEQALIMFVAFVGCWQRGMKIFLKLYYPMWLLVIFIDIIIAIMGVNHVEMRFYLHVVQMALGISIVSQSLSYYDMIVIPRERLQVFYNQQRTIAGTAGITGSFIAFLIGSFDIQIALWCNVIGGIISFVTNTYVLNQFKRIASKNKVED